MNTDIKNAKDPPVPADVAKELELLATIIKIVPGEHGFYAVTASSFNGKEIFITFSLKKEVLEEEISLKQEVLQQLPGTSVVLSNIIRKRSGWRALHARFFKPSDESSNKEVLASQSSQQRKEK